MTLQEVPAAARPAVRRLARRLALGLFLDVWPGWAAGAALAAGAVALACRLMVPAAAPHLPWLWLAPVLAVIPALIVCLTRAYRLTDVIAVADSLSGGQGLLLTLMERRDEAWSDAPLLRAVTRLPLPRLRVWRRLAPITAALVFLTAALLLPQRTAASGAATAVADDIAADLAAAIEALKEQNLVTPEEEQRLEEAIERVRLAAQQRMDASSWEAADALREQIAASAAAKQDAATWAREALARYSAAASGGLDASDARAADALAAELTDAVRTLAESGLLANAPADLQALAGGQLSGDPGQIAALAAALAEYLEDLEGGFGDVAVLAEGGGRFDTSEFPLAGSGPDGDGEPGRGGANRGRADAPLTWGEESLPADRFQAQTLPPGHVRRPDDWAPIVELPGAPRVDPERSGGSVTRAYADEAGGAAWRRTLAPRHQSAVKKYFQP